MAYDKPIEIKVVAPNLAGTEAKSVEAFMKIERLLTKTLAAGDIFKSPPASINTQTHDVTKSLFVRKDVEKLVTDTLMAHQDLFVEDLKIASKEARTKKYKVDIEGDRAMASLRANTAALGGKVYGNQNGNYIEIPSYKGSLKTATREATDITAKVREQKDKDAVAVDTKWGKLLLNKRLTENKTKEREEEKAKKDAEREALKKQREVEKQNKQKEAEDEKEKKSADTDAKHRGLTMLAGFGTSIFLLKKLVSLVENIMNGVIDAGEKSFKTTMDAMRLNIDPVVLRNLFYAGTAKGIGSAPVDMLTTMQSLFGTTLLAAENVGKIDDMAPVIGEVIGDLIRNGQAGTDPMGMASAIFDSVVQAYKEGKNALGQTGGTQSANAASLITMLESSLGESAALILTRMIRDIDTGKSISSYQSWITSAMPVSSPSNAQVASATGSYSDYLVAIAELKSILDMIKVALSPLLDKLTIAVEYINGFLMQATGNTTGVAELNRNNYAEMQAAIKRDKAEVATLEGVEKDYLSRNKSLFSDSKALDIAVDEFQKGVKPINMSEAQLKDFYSVAATVMLKRVLQGKITTNTGKDSEYKTNQQYALGTKTFSFVDSDLAQNYAYMETFYNKAMIQIDQKPYKGITNKEKEAKIKSMAMDMLVPQFSGDKDEQAFFYSRKSPRVREEAERVARKGYEYMEMYGGKNIYTQEKAIALDNNIAAGLVDANARRFIERAYPEALPKGANTAIMSRVNGEVTVVLLNSDKKEVGRVNVPVTEADASSITENETVKIDLYQQSN